jgi:hypothetical protein
MQKLRFMKLCCDGGTRVGLLGIAFMEEMESVEEL